MPIFEFSCDRCNKNFEELIFRRDECKAVICPFCRGRDVQKMVSIFGMRKGGDIPGNSGSSCTSCSKSSCAGCSQ